MLQELLDEVFNRLTQFHLDKWPLKWNVCVTGVNLVATISIYVIIRYCLQHCKTVIHVNIASGKSLKMD